MVIQKMTADHLLQVTKLGEQLGYPNNEEDIVVRFSKIGSSSEFGLFVAVSESGEVMGWIQVNEEPDTLLVGRRADISALVVDERYRKNGIGKALLSRAEEWVFARGLKLVRVKSNLARENAHRFYVREGYQLTKTSHMFTKNIEMKPQ